MSSKPWSCLRRLVVLAGAVAVSYGALVVSDWLYDRSTLGHGHQTYLMSLSVLTAALIAGMIRDRKRWWLSPLMLAAYIGLTIRHEITPEDGNPGLMADLRNNLDAPAVLAVLVYFAWVLALNAIGDKVFGPWETKDKIEV